MQHFELLPESALVESQSSLLASLTPELNSLLNRVETHLDKLARREQSLIAKCELQEGRLSSSRASGGVVGRQSKEGKKMVDDDVGDGVEQGREQLRLKQMRQKKERLSYAVDRLTLQAQQRERQLRMSMAAQ